MSLRIYEQSSYWYYAPNFVSRLVNAVIGIIEFMLTLRLVLVLLAANSGAPFVAWVYGVTDGMVAPFAGAFPSWNFDGYVLELSTIFAMIGYAIIGWLVMRLLALIFSALYDVPRP